MHNSSRIVPRGWKYVQLGDVATPINERNSSGNRDILTASARFGLVYQEDFFQKKVASADTRSYFLLHRGDFVYTKSYSDRYPAGATLRLSRHDSGVVTPLYICFRARQDVLDPEFIEHYFESGLLDEAILSIAKEGVRNHGLLNVDKEDFFALPLALPPLHEQRRIARILNEADDLTRLSMEIIEKYRKIERGLLHDVALLSVKDGAAVSCGRGLKVGEVGRVQLGRQRSDRVDTNFGRTGYLRVANVLDGYIDYSDIASMGFTPAERASYELRLGDILLNEGQSLELVGRSAIYDGPKNMCFQNTLIRFRSYGDLLPEYAHLIFRYWLYSGEFSRVAKRTTSIAHLGADRFAAMRFPLVGISEQQRLVEQVTAVADCAKLESGKIAKLQLVKKGLMDDLLTGKVRVGDVKDLTGI